jgi:adenylate cyclase
VEKQPLAATPLGAWLEARGGQRTPIRGTCYLGRAAGSHIVLPDDKVSRRHAMVHAQGEDEFWLIDLGSANGTYLNDRRVGHPCALTDTDQIRVGKHCFTFHHPKAVPSGDLDMASTQKTALQVEAVKCWLLVADIEGSTEFIRRLPAEKAPGVVGRWLAQCKQIIDNHGGAINKFLGDGFFAYWSDSKNAAKAVAEALAALKLEQEREQPRFRVVVHYGEVFAGGGASLGEESLMGNEVNLVFRLEKLAGSLGAARLLSEAAHDRIKKLLPTAEAGCHPVAGFDTEFSVFSF